MLRYLCYEMKRGIMVITLGQLTHKLSSVRESYSKQQRILFQFSLELKEWLQLENPTENSS